jgi:hypothetical protein
MPGFLATIARALKMPLGHCVESIWPWLSVAFFARQWDYEYTEDPDGLHDVAKNSSEF